MKRSSTQTANPRAFRPTLEQLETRLVPAITLQQLDLDGDGSADDIRIRGDGGNNKVQIFDTADNGFVLAIDANSDGDFNDVLQGDLPGVLFGISQKSVVFDVRLGGGKDTVEYTATNHKDGCARTLLARLGGGNDAFHASTGTQNLIGLSAFHFEVDAGGGADAVDFAFNAVKNSSLFIREALGGGNDTSAITFAAGIDFGADVKVAADLGAGDNVLGLAFQGVGFSDVASADVAILGGDDALHHDEVTVDLHNDVGNGALSSRLTVDARLQAGGDRFVVRPQINDFRVDNTSRAVITARGGDGNDRLSVKGFDAGSPLQIDPAGVFDIDLHGDAGNDIVSVDFGVAANLLHLDGTLRARPHGDAGADKVSFSAVSDDTSTGSYDVALAGGDGNDQVQFGLNKQQGSPDLGPAGAVLLTGGAGFDTLASFNAALAKAVQFEKTT